MTEDRPDPLAPLPPRAPRTPPGMPEPPDLSICAHMVLPGHCTTPPSVIAWVGCTKGEHAGPLAWCAAHATTVLATTMHCAQCGGEVVVMKMTSMDGTSVVEDFGPPEPPPGLWQEATGA